MSKLPFAATTPVRVGRVGLRARDAGALADFYCKAVGLVELSRDGSEIELGAGDRPLLRIEGDASARQDDPLGAGLFHTAFLLPTRADLGRWVRHAFDSGITIDGASDHLVSEAIYLTDPEGNGIEIYSDRPREDWPRVGNSIQLATQKLDIEAVVDSIPHGEAGWQGVPQNSVVGHVHLRVGDPQVAQGWWNSQFGLETMAQYGTDAVFMASGGYHHHIGANSWRSRGAAPRDGSRAGLAWVELQSTRVTTPIDLADPWGIQIRAVPVVMS